MNASEVQPQAEVLPPLPPGFNFPFYYASLQSFWLYYLVDPARIGKHLDGTGMRPALFDGAALVNINFQRYTAHLAPLLSTVNEIEFNIVAYPASRQRDVPQIAVNDYLAGQEQTKLVGNFRLHVAADNPHAVQAGVDAFGEPKFLTSFSYSVPDLNDQGDGSWTVQCNDPVDPTRFIFRFVANAAALGPRSVDMSPIRGYTMCRGRLLGNAWNLYNHYLSATAVASDLVQLDFGDSAHALRLDMQALIGDTPVYAMQSLAPLVAATQGRGYWVDPQTPD